MNPESKKLIQGESARCCEGAKLCCEHPKLLSKKKQPKEENELSQPAPDKRYPFHLCLQIRPGNLRVRFQHIGGKQIPWTLV